MHDKDLAWGSKNVEILINKMNLVHIRMVVFIMRKGLGVWPVILCLGEIGDNECKGMDVLSQWLSTKENCRAEDQTLM